MDTPRDDTLPDTHLAPRRHHGVQEFLRVTHRLGVLLLVAVQIFKFGILRVHPEDSVLLASQFVSRLEHYEGGFGDIAALAFVLGAFIRLSSIFGLARAADAVSDVACGFVLCADFVCGGRL